MKVRKSASAKQPGYPSSRQMARLARSIGAVAIGLAAPAYAVEGEPAGSTAKSEAAMVRTAGRIVVEPSPQVPGGIRAVPPQTTNATDRISHTVQKGDTLSSLALRYLGDSSRWKELAAANPGLDPEKLRAGTRVIIPAQSCTKTNEPPKLLGAPPMPRPDGAGR